MRHPDVILIYGDGADDCQIFGGHWLAGQWKCSEVIPFPAENVSEFLDEMRKMGRIVLDVRHMGDPLVPILIFKSSFSLKQASDFAAHMSGLIAKHLAAARPPRDEGVSDG